MNILCILYPQNAKFTRIADIVNIHRSSKIVIFVNTIVALGDTFHLPIFFFLIFCSDLCTKVLLLSNIIVPGRYTFTDWKYGETAKKRWSNKPKLNDINFN